ncbi:MAG: hypothetical protein JXQ29_01190 [Planctomycetes bacterium]|nr:hypothetical protein [Planctomycetota bacterium]
MRRLALLLLALAAGLAARLPTAAQDAPVAGIDEQIQRFRAAARDPEKRRAAATALFALGEPAFARVEALTAEAEARAESARAAAGEAPTPEQTTALREAEAEARAAAKVRDALHMEVVVNAFRELEKKHGNLNLVYAGQFEHLRKIGPRAVRGALALMRDLDLHPEDHHRKAWEVLADLGDRSVLGELKDISTDFLMDDEIQLGAVYAMAALGDKSGIEMKIRECQQRARDDRSQEIPMAFRMATIYYHGRQYKEAVRIYEGMLQLFETRLKEGLSEMSARQAESWRAEIANMAYNCACNLALDENLAGTYAMLARCLAHEADRANYLENIQRDGDLRHLRADEGFKAWYEKATQGEILPAPPGKDTAAGESPEVPPSPAKTPADPTPPQAPPVPGDGRTPEQAPPEPAPAGKKDEAKKPVSPADLEAADGLITECLRADTEARAPLLTKLAALGEAAFAALEARMATDPNDRALGKLHAALCAELVLTAFRAVESVDPDGTLTFAGQFAALRSHGKRAVLGALTLLKDDDAKMQYRTWAGDALGDLGDQSVLAELKEIAEDFLREDRIQTSAAYAMAALGEDAMLRKMIGRLEADAQPGDIGTVVRIGQMLYRGRRYAEAIPRYEQAIRMYTQVLEKPGEELTAAQREDLQDDLAGFHYSVACNHCLLGQLDETFQALDRCVANDVKRRFVRGIARDGDLRTLRENAQFKTWYDRVLKNAEAAEKPVPEQKKAPAAPENEPQAPPPTGEPE